MPYKDPEASETTPVALTFDPGEHEDLQVVLDEKAKKKAAVAARVREKMADRAAYEKLGIQVLRLKANTYRMLKAQIDELGIKTIGHCSIMMGREKAESVIAELDAIAQSWDEKGLAIDPQVRVALQSLKLDCIKLMVDSGAEHLRAERQPSGEPQKGHIQLPFEAGMPIRIAVGQTQPQQPAQIEGSCGVT